MIPVKVKIVSPLLKTLPQYATDGSAAMDLCACCEQSIQIPAGTKAKIPTGIAIALPTETVALIFPRSGLASKQGIVLSNAVGVIDSDYRGEIICLMQNDGTADFTVNPGDRIAQIAFFPVLRAQFQEVTELDATVRGEGGFGSTGIGKLS